MSLREHYASEHLAARRTSPAQELHVTQVLKSASYGSGAYSSAQYPLPVKMVQLDISQAEVAT